MGWSLDGGRVISDSLSDKFLGILRAASSVRAVGHGCRRCARSVPRQHSFVARTLAKQRVMLFGPFCLLHYGLSCHGHSPLQDGCEAWLPIDEQCCCLILCSGRLSAYAKGDAPQSSAVQCISPQPPDVGLGCPQHYPDCMVALVEARAACTSRRWKMSCTCTIQAQQQCICMLDPNKSVNSGVKRVNFLQMSGRCICRVSLSHAEWCP
jgi:hypothetical protein